MKILKKILKITGWTLVGAAMLVLLAALLVMIPAVQNFLIDKITTSVSGKTHSTVSIGRIGIAFPASVFLEEVFLDDQKKDTLLYAGRISANLDLIALIKGSVEADKITIDHLTANVKRSAADSAFNFNFIIDAFKSSDTLPKEEKKEPAGIRISFVELNDIHLLYDDQFLGMSGKTDFEKLEIKTESLDFAKMKFDVSSILFSNASVAFTITRESEVREKDTSGVLPRITLGNLTLQNIDVKYLNVPDSQFISVTSGELGLKKSEANLAENHFSAGQFLSRKTSVVIRSAKKEKSIDTVPATARPIEINVQSLSLKETGFSYDAGNETPLKSFDPEHLHIRGLDLEAESSQYASADIHSTIRSLSFKTSEGFEVKNFSAATSYSSTKIQLKELIAETGHSKITADLQCSFPSLDAFKKSVGDIIIQACISRSVIDPRDVTYFAPKLSGQPFLMPSAMPVHITCEVNGPVKDLAVTQLFIQAGSQTILDAKARITGLPDADKAYYDINYFRLSTSSVDIAQHLPANLIPAAIRLPETLTATGNFKGRIKQFDTDVSFVSSFGNINATVRMEPGEKYEAVAGISEFETGKLLKNEKMFGKVTLEASVKGSGFARETVNATVALRSASAEVNKYNYQQLAIDGKIFNQQFDGTIHLDDPNVVFDFKGKAGFKPGEENYHFTFDLKGANLYKLHLTADDIRVAAMANVELDGSNFDNLNGKAGITNIIVAKGEKTYVLDSLLFASVNENGKSEMSLSSAVVGLQFKGTLAPGKLIPEIKRHLNQYFPFGDSSAATGGKNNFTFEIQLHNHPIISEVFLPKLKEFEPGAIRGSFDGASNRLEAEVSLLRMDYNGTLVTGSSLKINSDAEKFTYSLHADAVAAGGQLIEALDLAGEAKDNVIRTKLAIGKDEDKRKLALNAEITSPEKNSYAIRLDNEMILGAASWKVLPDNQVLITKNSPPRIHVSIDKGSEYISVESVDSSATKISFRDFELLTISNLAKKDTAFVEGRLNGTFMLLDKGAFNAEAILDNLRIKSHPVGTITIKAVNSASSQISLNASLTGNENDLVVSGKISPSEKENALDLGIRIQSINMKSLEAFTLGQLQHSSGKITGELNCTGTFSKPLLNGELHFLEVATTPTAINTPLLLKNETIAMEGSRLQFTGFSIADKNNHAATLNGTVSFADPESPEMNLQLDAEDFLAMNSSQSGQNYFGTVVLDSKIKIKGTPSAVSVNASVKLEEGSYLGIAVPESKLTADRGENVVEFSQAKLHPILVKESKKENQKSGFRNLDIVADIQVDKDATLKILVDPASGDSLVVRGAATLGFALDPSGKVSLTGRYELNEGSYLVTLQDLIRKKFTIEKGSSITWNGDPTDAEVDMRAIYTVRTSPIDLIANQVSGMDNTERNKYKQRLPFEVVLKINGQLLKPDIAFEIQLPAESRGAMGGVVNARLTQLNEDESELNKQVFALLVLNRFIQEDPLASESGNGAEGIARQSVSRFLSQQLNQWSSRYISGVEIDFDVQSYDDYSTGQSEGRTEVGIGLKKQFNDRFSVQVGGSVDVEGERTKQNNLSDITGDILVEYKLTDDGMYRLKGFRQNEYEGIIEGQLTETGVGIVYTRDFDQWREIFQRGNKSEEN